MSFKTMFCMGVAAAGLTLVAADGIQTAVGGEMLVDLDAASLSDGLQAGEAITTWLNAGSQPDFTWVRTHDNSQNPTFQLDDGVPVVRFQGSSTGSLTNGVPTPAGLLGNQSWTIEAWFRPNKAMTDVRDVLSLTANDGLEDNAYTCAELQCDQSNGVGAEHYSLQLKWGRRTDTRYRPQVDKWSNVVLVHEASGHERLYVNGHAVSFANRELRLSGIDSFIVISGNFVRGKAEGENPWRRQAYADISRIRIQTGALTTAQVLGNFNAEKATFGLTEAPDALWTDGGTWFDGRAPEPGDNLILEGDQPLVYANGVSNAVEFITVDAAKGTGLVIENGSEFYVAYDNNLAELGNANGGSFDIDVKKGLLAFPRNSFSVGMYGPGTLAVGGEADGPGIVECGSSLRLGVCGGAGSMTVKANGLVKTVNELYLSDGTETSPVTATVEDGGRVEIGRALHITNGLFTVKGGGDVAIGSSITLYRDARILVEAGGHLSVTGSVYMANQTGPSVFDIYGTVDADTPGASPNIYVANNTADSVGTLNLYPGAVLNVQAMRNYGDSPEASGTVNVDTATLRVARYNRTWFVTPQINFNFKNEMTIEVNPDPRDERPVIAKFGAVIHDETEGGAGTIIKAGSQTLRLMNDSPSPIASHFLVREGRLELASANVLPAAYDGTFTLDGGEIAADFAGGAAMVLARLAPTSKGRFVITANNAQDNLDFSAYPDVEVVTEGSFTFQGRYVPYGNKYIFRPTNGEVVFTGDIGDVGGVPATVEIYGATDADGVTLAGVNDGMSGNISVFKGILGIAGGTESAGGLNTKLYLAEGTSLKLDARVGKTFLSTRLDPASQPAAILLTEQSANCDIDLSKFPGCRLGPGTTNAVVHTGALLPDADNTYLLGGGTVAYASSFQGLTPAPLVDVAGVPTRVQVGLSGLINLSNAANTYSGGTEVTDGAALYLSADGFGAVPEEFDAANIVLNNGVVRIGGDGQKVALAATRGVQIGPEGAVFHPWSNSLLDIPGGLSGSGPLSVTDNGSLAFSGAYNTYNGPINATKTATTLTIGSEENFSWVSEGGISTPGAVVLQNPSDATFNDTVSGAGSLTKRGDGTLTLTKNQPYTGATVIEGGTLVLADGAALSGTSSVRNDGEIVFSSIDALGRGKISGEGRFTVLEGGNLVLDGERIMGDPTFKVQKDATLEISGPDISARAEVTTADGANLQLDSGVAPDALNGFDGFTLNGTAEKTDGALRLTPAAAGAYGSAFYGKRVKVTGTWEAEMTYQVGAHGTWSTTEGVGVGFVLHGDGAGKKALSTTPGTGDVGCDFSPIEGAVMRLFDNGTLQDYYGFFSDHANTSAIKPSLGHLVTIKMAYDGTTLTLTYTDPEQNNNVRTRTKTVDMRSVFAGETAWIGFGAFSGESVQCEQFVRSFTYRHIADDPMSGDPTDINATDWALVQSARLADLDDGEQNAIELTYNGEGKRGCAWNKNRVRVDKPFTARFKYRVSAVASGHGYGFIVILHNNHSKSSSYDGIQAYGSDAGHYGFTYANATDNGAKTNAVGYVVNIYKTQEQQKFRLLQHNSYVELDSEADSGLKMFDLCDGADTDFVLRWDMTNLTITASREGFAPYSCSTAMDLQTLVGDRSAILGFSGGTSGTSWANQLIHDFHFAYDVGDDDDKGYPNRFVIEGATRVTLDGGTVGLADLELKDGAGLALGTKDGIPATFELNVTTVAGDATIRSGTGVPVRVGGTLAFTGAKGTLTLVGDVTKKGEKIVIDLADLKGVHKLIDLTQMNVPFTLDDFELADGVPQPLKMDIQGGVLRVWRDNATVLIFR